MEDFSDLLDGKTHFFGDLMREGLPSEILREFVRDLCDLLDRLDHVSWYVNSSRLLADRPSHGLAYPPYSIGTEPVAHPTVELLRRFHEPHIPLLHEVGKGKAAVHVLFCHGYDQSEVRFGEHVPCFDILLLCPLDPLNKLLQLGCGDARLHLCDESAEVGPGLVALFTVPCLILGLLRVFKRRDPLIALASVPLVGDHP